MSLQDISKEIISKAELQNQEIESQANAEMKTLEQEFVSNFETYKTQVTTKNISEQNMLKAKISSKYNKLAKELELDAKTKILVQVKSKALEKILTLDKSEREVLYKKLIKLAKNLIKYKIVYTSKTDLTLVKTLVSENIEVKSKENLHGLIFEIESGLEKLDLNFVSLFEDIFTESEIQTQEILFR